MSELNNLNLPAGVSWAPWFILALILVCATVVIVATIFRPSKETNKLQQTVLSALIALFGAVGGYLGRTPEILEKDHQLKNANTALDAYEEKVAELLTLTG